MTHARPQHILISAGREAGGVSTFAAGLAEGFRGLGLSVEVLAPAELGRRWRQLRDPRVLKILSTSALFMAPFARQVVGVAHGFPRADAQGWLRFLAILVSYRLANLSGASLVAVSDYAASLLTGLFKLRIDAVIHNPLCADFLVGPRGAATERNWICFVGRLHAVKNLHRILPALQSVLDAHPELRVCIIGDGPLRAALEAQCGDDRRFEFRGQQDSPTIREQLRRSRVLISGCTTEALGMVYLEALSQGCNVVMPAAGGGLEIAPAWIGSHIQLMPLSFDRAEIVASVRRALAEEGPATPPDGYQSEQIAAAYLRLYRS